MAFCSQKPAAVSVVLVAFLLFASDIGFPPVGRQTGSPSDQPADGGVRLCCFPGGLVEG